jgi:hypothetical protein
MVASGIEVAKVLGVLLGDVEEKLVVLIDGHGIYLLRIKALPVAGFAHPMFIETLTSGTCRQPPSE